VVGDTSVLDLLELLAIPILGSVFAQELVARVIASRNPTIARRSTLSAAGIYLFIGLIPVTLGMAAAANGVVLDHPEQVLMRVAGEVLPGVLYVVFAGALVSAILSTVDSALLVAGSLVAHNVVLPLRPGASERWKIGVNRTAVIAAGVLAYVLTRSHASVWDLVVEASGFGSAGIFVAATLGLLTRVGGSASALASLGTGLVVYVLGAHITPIDHPFLASLASSLVAYAAFALPVLARQPLAQRQPQSRRR
jgi:Na+/proline symporter